MLANLAILITLAKGNVYCHISRALEKKKILIKSTSGSKLLVHVVDKSRQTWECNLWIFQFNNKMTHNGFGIRHIGVLLILRT